jgi:hypothetical protein
MGHTSFPIQTFCIPRRWRQLFLHISDVSTNYVWHCNTEEEEKLCCINLQCNKEFLGNKAGENELIAIPDKTNRNLIPLCIFLYACISSYRYRLHIGTMYRIHKNVWDEYEY